MTPLEQQLLADGFRVLVLWAEWCPERGLAQWSAALCDGGRVAERAAATAGASVAAVLAELRRLLRLVLAPPHFVAGLGHGWRRLLEEQLAGTPAELRVLDLAATAAAFAGGSPRTPPEALLGTLTGGPVTLPDGGGTALAEELLWAVVGAAGQRGLDLPGLLAAAAAPRAAARFAGVRAELRPAAFPERPGVYIMRGPRGRPLYVGKAANLARRLADYLQPAWEVPPKLRALRAQVRRIEHRVVGSELEALLVEQQLIRAWRPPLNVQRELTVRETPAPYGGRNAVAIVAPSVAAVRVELFFSGPGKPALQVSCDPRRWPRRTLAALFGFYADLAPRPPLSRRTRDWGDTGAELCRRYFRRFRPALHWVELPVSAAAFPAAGERLREAVRTAQADPTGTEFRIETPEPAPPAA